MKKELVALSIICVLIGISIACLLINGSQAFAASFYPVGGGTYTLAGAGTNATATNIQLSSFKTSYGEPLTMADFGSIGYGAIDPNSPTKLEDITFTGITQNVNGTATLTGVTRGIDFVAPYTASTTLAYSHSGGAYFILTNTPSFYGQQFLFVSGNNAIWPTASSSVASKGYVDFVGSGGANAIPATFTSQGVAQLATALQASAGISTGSTGFNLVLPSSIAQSSHQPAFGIAVVTTTGQGYLSSSFLNNNYYDPAFGYNSNTYSLNLATTTVVNGTSILNVGQNTIGKNEYVATSSGSWAVPSGVTRVFARIVGGGGSGGAYSQCGSSGGSGGYSEGMINVSGSLAYTIGSGGAAVSAFNPGNGGGATSVGGLTANGGSGGSGSTSSNSPVAGGAGGSATGGSINSTGNTGAFCIAASGGTLNGSVTPSAFGSSYGYGGNGSTGTSGAGGSGVMILTY